MTSPAAYEIRRSSGPEGKGRKAMPLSIGDLQDRLDERMRDFAPVGLEDLGSLRLMKRKEVKYVFPACRLTDILEAALPYYRILEVNQERFGAYETTYLDTDQLDLFYRHVTGRLSRHKIRYRTYRATGNTFLEVKLKNNSHRTIKWRMERNHADPCLDEMAIRFIRDFLPEDCDGLSPVLKSRYTRITLAGKELPERITLDYDIVFSDFGTHIVPLPFLAVAEIKKASCIPCSPFAGIMKSFGIRSGSFSKYCMGNVLVRENLKANRLKPKIRLLKKIENEYECFVNGR